MVRFVPISYVGCSALATRARREGSHGMTMYCFKVETLLLKRRLLLRTIKMVQEIVALRVVRHLHRQEAGQIDAHSFRGNRSRSASPVSSSLSTGSLHVVRGTTYMYLLPVARYSD